MASRSMGRRVKPSGGYELFMWYFMRLSGLALVFLAVGHLFIMHILNNVETINYAFVASRWTAPRTGWIWRLWDAALISLAVIHGFNGLREVLYEYLGGGARIVAGTLTWTLTILFIGAAVFDPDVPAGRGPHQGPPFEGRADHRAFRRHRPGRNPPLGRVA